MEFPYPVIKRVIGFLPVLDVLNISKVSQSWKQLALQSLKRVKIDASTVYGGCWLKYYKGEKTARESNFVKFALDLSNCTHDIEHLYFDGLNDIPEAVFEILLSSQKELKTLVVNLKRVQAYYGDRIDEKFAKVITQGIIKHEKSLEKINIGIEGLFISFEDLADGLRGRSSWFPNLRSIEFLSTTAGNYERYKSQNGGDYDENINRMVELYNAEKMFKQVFHHGKIEELNFKHKMSITLHDDFPETLWCPPFIALMIRHFELGAFSNLRKINIDSLHTRGAEGKFSQIEADLLIQNCPCITHIDSDILCYSDDDNVMPAVGHDKPFIKMIKHYGPQLVHLRFYMNTNIAKCIAQNCPNVKNLTIADFFGNEISDLALIALCCLSKLKKLAVFFYGYGSLGLEELLENCAGRLTKLQVFFHARSHLERSSHSKFNPHIFQIIKEHGMKLQTLILNYYVLSFEDYESLIESFMKMLESCPSLKWLKVKVHGVHIDESSSIENNIWEEHIDKITHLLISNHPYLRKLGLFVLNSLFEEAKQIFIKSMPYCKMNFNYYSELTKF